MAERALSGIFVDEQNGPEYAIERVSVGVTAFVGRALKGPLNTPVVINGFADYQRNFGGLWQPSTMSYAVEQFFECGGREAIIVRVANAARPPSITLRAGAAALTLTGLAPGSREWLRASVDYDGLHANEPDQFNLVVQRLRNAGSELIEDQEIYRRLSTALGSPRYVVDALSVSRLVRVTGEVPAQRPDRSPAAASGAVVGYSGSNTDGDDGQPLSDYDIIGSAHNNSGLFSLRSAPYFGLLCIPPLSRSHDVGASTLLVAGRLCRERNALLAVDPPAAWSNANEALARLRDWPFHSDNAMMFFPRIVAVDRLRGRYEVFAACGAVAGLMAREDADSPWRGMAGIGDSLVLRQGMRSACLVDDAQRQRLAQNGANTLQNAPPAIAVPQYTLATGGASGGDWRNLAMRRLALLIASSIEQGTRWVMFEHNAAQSWQRARSQVAAFLEALDQEGAFGDRSASANYFVICDRRLNTPVSVAERKFHLLYGLATSRRGEFQGFLVTHQAGASRVKQVVVNRLATSGREVEAEIETALLRGLTATE